MVNFMRTLKAPQSEIRDQRQGKGSEGPLMNFFDRRKRGGEVFLNNPAN